MKKIAVINDLSGMGKCSLTAAIPVISVMGVQACPLPTAILSAQTGYPSYYCLDLTEHMDAYMEEWKKMDLEFDGIYTGFLSSAEQAECVLECIDLFKTADTKILVDPVMGDNGQAYPIYSEALCERMRELASKAAVITPNLTEALLLLSGGERAEKVWPLMTSVKEEVLKYEAEEIGMRLSGQYHNTTVITGIDLIGNDGTAKIGNLICENGSSAWVITEKTGGSYSGTGDLFASVLAAGMVKGIRTEDSVHKAVEFLSDAIRDAHTEGTDRNDGICFEKYLSRLL